MTLLDRTPLTLSAAADPAMADTDAIVDGHALLSARAAFLREVAADVDPLVATSIRRRASELELAAWVLSLRSP